MNTKSTLTLFLLAAGVMSQPVLAQTKTPVKPATTTSKTTGSKPAATKTTSTAKPAATKSTTAKPTTTRTTTPARPAAKPASQPATTAAPAPAAPVEPAKLEIPGVAPQKAPSFAKGTIGVNLGVGLGIGYGYGFGYGGNTSSSPAISLSVEKGIVEGIGPGVISVGGLVGYKSYSYKWDVLGDDYKATWSNIYIAARGAYHYNFTNDPKVDTYAGVSVAARVEKYSDNYNGASLGASYGNTYLDAGIFLGGRYLFTEKIGGFAELGYDMSYLKLGLTTKF